MDQTGARDPLVSIGLPVRNGADALGRTLDSLLAQHLTNFEIQISDNASDDGTWDICRDYASLDPRIRIHRFAANVGASKNFNVVFQRSRGTYFKWVGADDVLHPTFLGRHVAVLESHPEVVLVYCGERYRYGDGRLQTERNHRYRIDGRTSLRRIHQWMWKMEDPRASHSDLAYGLIRQDALMRTRLITDTLYSNWLLVLELAALGPFAYIPSVLVERSTHEHRLVHERLRRLNPALESRFPHWALLWEFLRTARRSQSDLLSRITAVADTLTYFLAVQHRRLLWDLRRSLGAV